MLSALGRKVLSRSKPSCRLCSACSVVCSSEAWEGHPGCLFHITGGPHFALANSATSARVTLESLPHVYGPSHPTESSLMQFLEGMGALKLQPLSSHSPGAFCPE